MGILSLMDIGKSALMANQLALQVTGQNISNVSTTGYTKQELVLEAADPMNSQPGQVGMGVKATEIKRQYDSFIENEIISQQQTLGQLGASADASSQVEQVFNEANNTGVGNAINDFFSAVQDLSNNPSGSAERTTLVAKADTLTQFVKQSYGDLSAIRASTDKDISDQVGTVNDTASQIAQLNQQITEAQAEGQNPNDLIDKRTQLLKDLAGSIGFSTYENASGVNIVIGGGISLVEGGRAFALKADKSNTDGLNIVEYDNGSGNIQDITSQIKSGKLGGLLDARDRLIPKFQDGLDNLSASVTNEMNKLNRAGFGLDGSTGVDFFTPLGATAWSGSGNSGTGAPGTASVTNYNNLSLDQFQVQFTSPTAYDITDAATGAVVSTGNAYTPGADIMAGGMKFSVTGAPASGDVFYLSAAKGAASNFSVSQAVTADGSKIAAATDPTMLPGDNRNALAMAALQDSPEISGKYTFSDYYSSLVSDSGVESQRASTQNEFQTGLLQNLENQRDNVSGVSLDEETTNLLKYQRAYQAAAKVISVADQLLQTVLQIQ